MTPLHKYQTFSKRWLASFVDGLLFLPITLAGYWIEEEHNLSLYIGWTLFYLGCWTLYLVIGHGRYGQTIGKRLVGIKVFRLDEQQVIGYKRAFLREAVWFFVQLAGVVYLLMLAAATSDAEGELSYRYEVMGFTTLFSTLWLALELATMLFNRKRRALHDLIAGSVVVDTGELQREDLHKRQEAFLATLPR